MEKTNQGKLKEHSEAIKTTTIKISEITKERLNHLKEHKEESADSLITKALNIVNLCARSPSLASRILRDIETSKKRKELLENSDSVISRKTTQNPENLIKSPAKIPLDSKIEKK
jgi:maleate cis-trans isomerase